MEKKYYEILKVEETASLATIKKSYQELKEKAKKIADIEKREKKVKKLEKAYKILSNPEERKNYDLSFKEDSKDKKDNNKHSEHDKNEEKEYKEKPKKESKKNKQLKTLGIIVGVVALVVGLFFLSELSGNNSMTPQKKLTNISYPEFTGLVKSSTKTVVMVGRPDCSWCQKLMPIMQNLANKNNIDIKYLNVNNFTEEDFAGFDKLDKASNPNSNGGTPMTFIVANGKIEARLDGYVESDKVEAFLKTNKIIS